MARRSPHRAAYEDYKVTDEERRDSAYLGTVSSGAAMFYHPDSNSIFEGKPDEEDRTINPVPETEERLDDGESVGDAVKRIGDELGWDGLSEFAEDHLGAGGEGAADATHATDGTNEIRDR